VKATDKENQKYNFSKKKLYTGWFTENTVENKIILLFQQYFSKTTLFFSSILELR